MKRALGKLSFVREAVAALAYFVMPLDVIPDLIAVLGFTDNATVFWAVYRLFVPHVNDVH